MVPARRSLRVPKTSADGVHDGVAVALREQQPQSVAAPIHAQLGLTPERLLEMFETMLLARALDERQWILNRQGRQAFHISCQGHEASGVGSAFALDRSRDVMVPYYRSLAAVLAFGVSARDIFLSALAKADDPMSGGRQMPAHYGLASAHI